MRAPGLRRWLQFDLRHGGLRRRHARDILDYAAQPRIAGCNGGWLGSVNSNNATIICQAGWHLCSNSAADAALRASVTAEDLMLDSAQRLMEQTGALADKLGAEFAESLQKQ